MAAQKGIEMLLKYDSGGGTFVTIGGGRAVSLSINNAQVDITSQDNTSRQRALLAGAGVRTMAVSFNGIFVDDAAQAALDVAVRADTHDDYQLVIPNYGTYEGAFQVGSLEMAGEHDGEVTFSITLESAGDISFT